MSGVRVINSRNNLVILSDLREARGVWQRFAGLMLRPSLATGHGLLFRPARGLHTHCMRFAIDLIFLDERDRVQAIRSAMPPWRFDERSAAAVIEANAGTITAADLRVGDQVRFEAG